jgi:excisionase family DNA binding protein
MSAEYLSKKDLGDYLKISSATVSRLMQQGLPYIKLERRVLFRRADVDRFLESKIVRKR